MPFSDYDMLLPFGDIRDQVAKLSKIPPMVGRFRDAIFCVGPPNTWRNFINLGHRRTYGMILGGEKKEGKNKERINTSTKSEWPHRLVAMAMASVGSRSHSKTIS